ncbi:MAG TPA: hypothetical protein VNO70_25075 [Blastocatellia bacterium]|nr:hypothetical protein [Blastocatellia bacterium]
MESIPTFLDFEASSLSSASYPIEVAWNLEDGSIEDYLISPQHVQTWTDWDPEAEKVHGISREELLLHGKPPSFICARMNQQLTGKVVYTDAPLFDGAWLSRLFSACGDRKPGFELRHIDELLVKMICPEIAGRTYGLIKIDALKQEARRQKPRQHRAAWDVEYLIQLWRLAVYEVKK